MLRSFQRLMAVDPGFETDRLLTLHLYFPPRQAAGYSNPFAPASGEEGARTRLFYRTLTEDLRALPGVTAAGLVSDLPFTGDVDADGTVAEGREPPPGAAVPVTQILRTGPGYFQTMKIPLLPGRDFAESDREASEHG